MAPTTTTTIEPTPRPSSRGAFELHVQSVRAARGLPHLVVTPNTPNPNAPAYVVPPSIPVAAYRSSDEKSSFDNDDSDSGSISIVVGEAKSESRNRSGNRLTNDDGPEPRTLARDLFLFGFLLPLFWCVGASILFLDLKYHQTPEEAAEDPRTHEERIADLKVLRRAEVRWAWRSIYAIVVLILSIASALLIWAGVTGRFTGIH